MIKIFNKYIFENIQSEKEISNLSLIIIKKVTESFMIESKRSYFFKDLEEHYHMDFNYVFELGIDDNLFKDTVLKDFIKNLQLYNFAVYFSDEDRVRNSSNIGGFFSSERNCIVIYIKYLMENNKLKWNKNTSRNEIYNYFMRYKKTLDHELTHAYDNYISKSKYVSKDYVDFDSNSDNDKYFKQNLEVNAFYTSAVNAIEDDISNNWDYYLSEFKINYKSWNVLSKQQQNRLMNRLYKRWLTYKHKKTAYLNNKSFQLYHSIEKGNLESVLDRRSIITFDELIKYMKKSIKDILSNKVTKEEYSENNYSKNRYNFLSLMFADVSIIKTIKLEIERVTKEEIKEVLEKRLKITEEAIEKFKHLFNLNNENFNSLVNIIKEFSK